MRKSLPPQSYPIDLAEKVFKLSTYPKYYRGLYRAKAKIKESNLHIISDKEEAITLAIKTIYKQRMLLEDYIRKDLRFRYALKPIKPIEDAPKIVKLACRAAEEAEVGPMAALPGALADLAVENMNRFGCRVRVVENGGEIAAASDREICVLLYAGSSPISFKIGFVLEAEPSPVGLATSSATVSHAISFGEADAAVVYAKCAALADAAATRVCNAVKGEAESAVQRGLDEADKIDNIYGVLIVKDKYVGIKGRLPKIVKIKNQQASRQIYFKQLIDDVLERYF